MVSDVLERLLDEIAESEEIQEKIVEEVGGSPVDQFYQAWHDIEETYEARDDESLKWDWFLELQQLSDALCDKYGEALASLKQMEDSRVAVLRKTMSLHGECEDMSNARKALENRAFCIESKLEHFQRVRTISNTLDQGFGIEFEDALDKLDDSMAFLEDHKDYLQAEQYMRYFDGLRDRICAGIRTAVSRSLERSHQQVVEQIWTITQKGGHLSSIDDMSVLYDGVQHSAGNNAALTQMLLTRTHPTYKACVDELEALYTRCRINVLSQLVPPILERYVSESDLPTTTRRAASFTMSLCQMEKQLFETHFDAQRAADGDALKRLLEYVASIFSEAFRPQFLTCTHIDDLREVADCLHMDVLLAQRDAKSSHAVLPSVLTIIYRLHKDVLERLISRIHAFLRDEIRSFPIEGDVCHYPDLLWSEAEQQARGVRMAWFPPMDHTLTMLSKVYRILEIAAFQTVAQEAVDTVLRALRNASVVIKQHASALDAGLFMIKHLLILREQAAAFECDLVSREKFFDFNGFYTGFTKMLQTENTLLGYSSRLIDILTPKVQETSYDTRRDIETELKQSCEVLIHETVRRIARPLILLHATMEDYKGDALKDQAFMQTKQLQSVVEQVKQNMTQTVPLTVAKLCMYLSPRRECTAKDKTTINILFKPIIISIVESWAQLGLICERADVPLDVLSKERMNVEMGTLVANQLGASWQEHIALAQTDAKCASEVGNPSASTSELPSLEQRASGSLARSPASAGSPPACANSLPASPGVTPAPILAGSLPASDGGLPTPVSSGGLPAPASSLPMPVSAGSLPTPVSAGSLPAPVSAGGLPAPVPAGSLPAPVSAGSLPAPVSAGGLPAPVPAGSLPAPVSEGGLPAPVPTGSLPAPVSAGSLPMPVSAGSLPAPVAAGSLPAPVSAGSLPMPVPAGSLPAPTSVASSQENNDVRKI